MKDQRKTVDFGAPKDFGAHLFRVEIPAARGGKVVIAEDFGYRGSEAGIHEGEDRAVLERSVWSKIADAARREFNERLKVAKLHTGRWHTGTNLVERLLGRELCVLAWAAETASDAQLPVVGSKWAALRPEERWWLFAMTVAEEGRRKTASEAGVARFSTPSRTARRRRLVAGAAGLWNQIS